MTFEDFGCQSLEDFLPDNTYDTFGLKSQEEIDSGEEEYEC